MVDLGSLLRGDNGDAIRVAGVRVGEPASGIERFALTGADENAPGEPRTWMKDSVYRTSADGSLVEVPLGERVEATLQRGGTLRVGQVALRIEGGLVERIFVRGPALLELGWTIEADIERALGPAAGVEWSFGRRLRHYPQRKLVVAWSPREGRVEHVALGPTTWVEPRLGAAELLAELLAVVPAPTRPWVEPERGSGQVRYRRVAALSRALGVGTPAELVAGAFLDRELDPGRQAVIDELAAAWRTAGTRDFKASDWLFRSLLTYRWDVERIVTTTSGWLECSDPALLGMIAAQNAIGARLRELMVDVDRWLRTLIDPEGRTFELRQLVERHGWPDVDLRELEMDEL